LCYRAVAPVALVALPGRAKFFQPGLPDARPQALPEVPRCAPALWPDCQTVPEWRVNATPHPPDVQEYLPGTLNDEHCAHRAQFKTVPIVGTTLAPMPTRHRSSSQVSCVTPSTFEGTVLMHGGHQHAPPKAFAVRRKRKRKRWPLAIKTTAACLGKQPCTACHY
jgi:hypothetical protein